MEVQSLINEDFKSEVKGKFGTILADPHHKKTRKREHSKKPDELYRIIEECSPGPFLELFARGSRNGWKQWGNEVEDYRPNWPTYPNNSYAEQIVAASADKFQPGLDETKEKAA